MDVYRDEPVWPSGKAVGWEREGVKDGCYNLLLAAAAACPWLDRSAIGYPKWGHLCS